MSENTCGAAYGSHGVVPVLRWPNIRACYRTFSSMQNPNATYGQQPQFNQSQAHGHVHVAYYIYILMIWEEWTSEATWSDQFIGSIKITVFLTLITCIIKTILHSFFFAVIQGVRVCVVCLCGSAAHMVGSSILNCNRLVDRLTLLPLYNQSFVRSFRLSVHLVDESDCKMDIYS